MSDPEQPRKRMRMTSSENEGGTPRTVTNVNDESVREARVGIDRYVLNDTLGFSGVFKKRYTDFLVNEILPTGEVVHLGTVENTRTKQSETESDAAKSTQEHIEKEKQESPKKTSGEEHALGGPGQQETTLAKVEPRIDPEPAENEFGPQFEVDSQDLELLHSIFTEPTTIQILALHRKVLKYPNRKRRDFDAIIAPQISDRQLRTQAHQALRRIFSSKLESNTDGSDGRIHITAATRDNSRSNARNVPTATASGKKVHNVGRGKVAWDQLGGEYLHFSLAKENKDTMEVASFIGSKLHLNSKHFGFAGTKDKRAVTVQRMSAFRLHRDALAELNEVLYLARVGDFEYRPQGLDLGDLKGNEFTITLRDCEFVTELEGTRTASITYAEDILKRRTADFEKHGFINYYGLQRFGTHTHGTEKIGIKMLQQDFESAVAMLLSYNPDILDESKEKSLISGDDIHRAEAMRAWERKQDIRAALEKLPRRFNGEAAIIKHLGWRDKKTGKTNRLRDFQGALAQLPRNLRLMYVHAYQSLVWNVVAGKRLELYGNKPVEGDLVIVGEKGDIHTKNGSEKKEEQEEIDDAGEVIVRPTGEDSAVNVAASFTRARHLSEEEAESGAFSIFDIVLPQPGFDVEYPKNAVGDFYKEFMGSERGGGLDPYDMRRKWKETSLSGGYRKLMARPLGPVSFELKTYTDPEEQLVETELDKYDTRPKPEANGASIKDKIGLEDTDMRDAEAKKERLAVILKLQLGSSQYATMALRELTRGGAKSFKPEYGTGR
ncbi:MAG: hypothetical protein M1820_002323 [Bogoriella megaspora]|nr:MAG: hypothetical protein M1820_002323 [Bogoriella megaspora]